MLAVSSVPASSKPFPSCLLPLVFRSEEVGALGLLELGLKQE